MNKTDKTKNISGVLLAADALLLFLCVKVFAPVCTGTVETVAGKQMPMKCHYTSVVLIFLSILLLANAVVSLVTKQGKACGIMAIVISVFVFVVFSDTMGIGICMKPEMACHVTAPFAKLLAVVQIIIGAIMTVVSFKKAE